MVQHRKESGAVHVEINDLRSVADGDNNLFTLFENIFFFLNSK